MILRQKQAVVPRWVDDLLPTIYESIWRNMERENALINFRITWAILLSAAMITAEAFLAGRLVQDTGNFNTLAAAIACGVMIILSIIGIVVSVLTIDGVGAAVAQLADLKTQYESWVEDGKNLFEHKLHFPRPFGSELSHARGNTTARIFPIMMLALWIVFGTLQFFAFVILLNMLIPGINSTHR
jgi:hypothetical protein